MDQLLCIMDHICFIIYSVVSVLYYFSMIFTNLI